MPNPDLLPPDHKRHNRKIIRKQQRRKYSSNDRRVTIPCDPCQQFEAHSKRNGSLPHVHGNQHLGYARIMRVNSISKCKREVEVSSPGHHRHAEEVADPVEIVLARETVNDETSRGNNHDWEQGSKSHFGFADVVIASRIVSGELVGRERQWNSEQVASCACHSDETRVLSGPVVWRGCDFDGESQVNSESRASNVQT